MPTMMHYIATYVCVYLCHGRQEDQRNKVVHKSFYSTLAIKSLTMHHPFN